jgi:hypothetical protein
MQSRSCQSEKAVRTLEVIKERAILPEAAGSMKELQSRSANDKAIIANLFLASNQSR